MIHMSHLIGLLGLVSTKLSRRLCPSVGSSVDPSVTLVLKVQNCAFLMLHLELSLSVCLWGGTGEQVIGG